MKDFNRFKQLYKMCGINYFSQKMIKHAMPIFSVKNTRVRSILWQEQCMKKINKYLNLEALNKGKDAKVLEESKTIWILWLQGEDQMPEVVKKCYESVLKNSNGYKVVLLDENNLSNYIKLPAAIEEKYKKGLIQNAAYSDIVRIALLAKHGGIWMDSTIYLTDDIPQFIKESKVFFYQASKLDCSPIRISSWFIAAKYAEDPIILTIRDSVYAYWQNENHLMDYNVFHLIISALLKQNEFKKEWNKMPYICNMNPHVMQFALEEDYTEEKWKVICETSSLHKLAWRLDSKDFNENSIFSKVMS